MSKEHSYLQVPAHRAELARLFLAEAERGEVLRCADSGLGLPLMESVDIERHLRCARELHAETVRQVELRARIKKLHDNASTPEEIYELMQLRGRPRLGMLLLTYRQMRAHVAVRECERKAELLRAGVSCGGWFEDGERPMDPEPREKVARAMDWAAIVFRRYALIQPPETPYVELEVKKPAGTERRKRATWKR